MDSMLRDKMVIAILLIPGLLLFFAFFIAPIGFTLKYSLTSWQGFGAGTWVGFKNYIDLFSSDPVFWRGVKNTFILLFMSITGQIIPALFLALILNHLGRGSKAFKTFYFIPVILSTVAIALMWNKMYEPNFGMVNEFFRFIGSGGFEQEWLSNPDVAIYAVSAPIVWRFIGYHLIIIYAGLKGIPEQYFEAAIIDGASWLKATMSITLPLLRDIVKITIVLAAIGSLKVFDLIYVMTEGGPFNSTTTVAIHMYKEAFTKFEFGYGSSVAMFLVLECLVIAFIINKTLTRESIEY